MENHTVVEESEVNGVDDGGNHTDTHEPVKLNAGSEQTKAQPEPVVQKKGKVPVPGQPAGTPKDEDDEGVLGKRPRKSGDSAAQDSNKAPAQPAKKPKVEDAAAKAERRRILEEKKRLLADVEKELAKISQKSPSSGPAPKTSASAPNTPLLSGSSTTPAPAGRGAGRGRGRGAATAAAGGGRGTAKSPSLATPKKEAAMLVDVEGAAPAPTTPLPASADPTTTGPATGTRGKRKSPGSSAAGIPRRASYDVGAPTATSPTEPQGPVTRAKRARRPKRLDSFGGPASLSWALKQCQVLLKTLMTHRFGWPFNQPVDPIALNIPDYFDVIKNPMDLGTIKEQLDAGYYENEDEFAEDVRLVWSNTFTYNQPGSDICIMANTLASIFNEKFEILKSRIEERGRGGGGTPEGVEQTIKELRDSMSSVQRELERIKKTPNGRRGAREEDVRPMTFEEKKNLSHAINNLPSDNLGMVVKIIHERMPQLTASGEEIEIDIDALNPATLRHLERYVRSVTQRAGGRRRGGRATPLSASSGAKHVQNANEPLVPLGTQQKIEDVERQIKALTEHQQALTQKGLARSSGETDLLMAAAEEKKKKRNDESDSSESETDGSDESDSSDSETSESESDSGSDSESTDSESEKKDSSTTTTTTTTSAPTPTQAAAAESTTHPAAEGSTAATAVEAAASVTSPATASSTSAEAGAHQENGKAGSAISFSFDPTLGANKESTLPAEVGNGDESLQQAAVAADDAPPKAEAPKEVALKNVDAWSELSDDFDARAEKPQSPPSLDKTWSQFQTKKMQDAMREKERLEKEERERKERERREEERRQEEERRRRELEEAEERRRREIEEAELAAQRERERQRQAERLAREKGTLSMMEQSLLMASFEQQAPPALPLFQYKQLDDEEADFADLDARQQQLPMEESESLAGGGGGDGEGQGADGSSEGAEMELSPTAPLPVPASDEMEEGQI